MYLTRSIVAIKTSTNKDHEEFSTLKEAARVRRDKIVKQANADYEATIKRITELADDLLGVEPNRKTTADVVNTVIPSDGTFTTGDIMLALESADPGRIWNERAVINHIARLREKNIIKRVRRAERSERAVYARIGVEYKTPPLDDLTLAQVIEQVLSNREPLRVAEVAVAVLALGYDTIMSHKSFLHTVDTELKAHDQFCQDAGKWRMKTPG